MIEPDNAFRKVAAAIVGGGPAGLTTAAALAPLIDGDVLVIEREAETGGIPRHSDHPGYGIRDLKRFISGPAYARRLTDTARDAGAHLETEAMVTGWSGARRLEGHLTARQTTGRRRRSRAGHRRPGAAPAGAADSR